jgi:NTP pyrophosphatase (non-canonical NTP hydrolase)
MLELTREINRRLKEKGDGTFVSSHEVLGVVTEEYHEMLDAVHDNDLKQMRKELLDIAVPCIIGVISVDKGMEF